MNSHYENLYGVGLLDDLHNYFPALLYDSSSFSNVGQVLTYVQQQTRNRFDLFSLGQRSYASSQHPVAPAPSQPNPQRAAYQTVNRVVPYFGAGGITSLLGRPTSNLHAGTHTPIITTDEITYTIPLGGDTANEEEDDMEGSTNTSLQTAQALLSLLSIPTTTLTRPFVSPLRGNALDAFLQPIVVRPTAEQITRNTTVGNVVSDTEHTCTICQELLLPEQEGRKLNACAHWFHRGCIDTWFQRNVHCPVCRHDIREPASRNRSRVASTDHTQEQQT